MRRCHFNIRNVMIYYFVPLIVIANDKKWFSVQQQYQKIIAQFWYPGNRRLLLPLYYIKMHWHDFCRFIECIRMTRGPEICTKLPLVTEICVCFRPYQYCNFQEWGSVLRSAYCRQQKITKIAQSLITIKIAVMAQSHIITIKYFHNKK